MELRRLGPLFLLWPCIAPAPARALAAETPAEGGVVPAAEFANLLVGSRAADLSDTTVEGDVDLRSLEAIRRPVRCQGCRFSGSFTATDLIFERIVDFSGSVFRGRTDLAAAVFRDRAGFENVVFETEVTFGSARFTGDASFSGAEFRGPAAFDRAQFGSSAVFSDTAFSGPAGFGAAQLSGVADFSGAAFEDEADFTGTGFGKRASFARATFGKLAEFRGASFAGGANLGVEKFEAGFNLEAVSAAGTVEFLGAGLEGEGVLANFSSTGTLSLDGLRAIGTGSKLFLDRLSVARLTMDVEEISVVRGRTVQKEVLKLVERSGRESGDLALANRARFEFLDLEGGEKEGFVARVVDRVFFRDIAGYLVRPSHPLLTLLSLVVIAGVIRSFGHLREATRGWAAGTASPGTGRFKRRLRRAVEAVAAPIERILDGISTTVHVALNRKADHIERKESEKIRDHAMLWMLWIEFLVYKGLIAVFLLALGNSNSTVRQLFEAVTG